MRFIFIYILIIYNTLFSAQSARLLEKLEQDINDQYLDDFSHIEAAFILSGIQEKDSLTRYLGWYQALLKKVKNFPFDPFHKIDYAEKIFIYLHSTWLKEYQKESTTLLDIVKRKQFNCVSATVFYNLICEDLNLSTGAFETPTHVYTIFSEGMSMTDGFNKNVIIENTSSMGFNMLKNLKSYSQYLAKFYPENEVLKIGLDRLYAYEYSKGRQINNTELLGLLAYNQAYFAMKRNDYENAYRLVLLAQLFNNDSRSNIDFELRLYFQWGKRLFDSNKFMEAFEVFADAFYRYPTNQDFIRNTRASFYKAIQAFWVKKTWNECTGIIDQIFELDILDDKDVKNLKSYLTIWISYFIRIKDKEHSMECIKYYESIFGADKDMVSFRKLIEQL
jgi:hypothetical protein